MKNKDKKNKESKKESWNFMDAEKIIREQRNKQNITQSNKGYGLLFE